MLLQKMVQMTSSYFDTILNKYLDQVLILPKLGYRQDDTLLKRLHRHTNVRQS